MSSIEKGVKVVVYDDPITCLNREGTATVTKVLRREDWQDAHGRQIVRCNVRFDTDEARGERHVFERDVSATV